MGSGFGFRQSWLRRETLAIPEHLIIANILPSTALQRSLPPRLRTLKRCPVLWGAGRSFGVAGFIPQPQASQSPKKRHRSGCFGVDGGRSARAVRRQLRAYVLVRVAGGSRWDSAAGENARADPERFAISGFNRL